MRAGAGGIVLGSRTQGRSELLAPCVDSLGRASVCRTTPASSWTCTCRGNGECPRPGRRSWAFPVSFSVTPLRPLAHGPFPAQQAAAPPRSLCALPLQLRQQPHHWRQGPRVHPDERGRGEPTPCSRRNGADCLCALFPKRPIRLKGDGHAVCIFIG